MMTAYSAHRMNSVREFNPYYSGGPKYSVPLIGEGPSNNVIFDIAALIIPAVSFVEFTLIGRIFATEMLLIALLPITVILRGKILLNTLPILVLGMGLVWLGGQIIVDLILDTSFRDYSRGWAKITFMLLNFASLYLLLADYRRRIICFIIGLGIGTIFLFIFNPPIAGLDQPWKFGLGLSLVYIASALLQRRGFQTIPFMPALVFFAISAFFMVQGYRSGGGIAFMTGAYLLVTHFSNKDRRPSGFNTFVLIVLGIGMTVGVLQGYEFIVREGFLGEKATEVLTSQTKGDLGVLLGGRSEILVASQAIMDSPLLGHGSWAKDPYYSYLYAEMKFGDKGGDIPFLSHELIPSHSVIFGTWVESGVVGAIFWSFVLILTVRVLVRLFSSDDPLVPLIAFLGFLMLWDVLFSPFGADRRFTLAFYIVLMTLVYPALYSSTNPYLKQDDREELEDDFDDEYDLDDEEFYDPEWEEREKYRTLDLSTSRRRR